MGLSFKLPDEFNNISEQEATEQEPSGEEEEAEDEEVDLEDLATFLNDTGFTGIDKTEDVPVDGDDFAADLDDNNGGEPVPDDPNDISFDFNSTATGNFNPSDLDLPSVVNVATSLPVLREKESTFEAFLRLTDGQPWVPFANAAVTEVDKCEHALFDIMEPDYERRGALSGSKGHKSFARAWDQKVVDRYKEHVMSLDGEPPLLFFRKSYIQLQDHYDNVQSKKRQAALVRQNDPLREDVERTLLITRRAMPEIQEAINVLPVTYNVDPGGRPFFGNPTTLNTGIAANAFTFNHGTPQIPFTWTSPLAAAQGNVLRGFQRNKCCCKCEYPKRLHAQHGTTFGSKCVNNCLRQECSQCGTRDDLHKQSTVGPCCTLETTQTDWKDWTT